MAGLVQNQPYDLPAPGPLPDLPPRAVLLYPTQPTAPAATAPHGGGVLVIDDSGDRKDGTKTAHVGHQWLGRYGKTDNGVVTVTTVWADERVYYPVHAVPYTPARHFAKGKNDPEFRTKLAIGAELAVRARAAGFCFRAVVADSAYGDQDGFRAELAEAGLPFVMALRPRHGIWARAADAHTPVDAARGGSGRRRRHARRPEGRALRHDRPARRQARRPRRGGGAFGRALDRLERPEQPGRLRSGAGHATGGGPPLFVCPDGTAGRATETRRREARGCEGHDRACRRTRAHRRHDRCRRRVHQLSDARRATGRRRGAEDGARVIDSIVPILAEERIGRLCMAAPDGRQRLERRDQCFRNVAATEFTPVSLLIRFARCDHRYRVMLSEAKHLWLISTRVRPNLIRDPSLATAGSE